MTTNNLLKMFRKKEEHLDINYGVDSITFTQPKCEHERNDFKQTPCGHSLCDKCGFEYVGILKGVNIWFNPRLVNSYAQRSRS